MINHLRKNEIKVDISDGDFKTRKPDMDRSHVTKILASPLYVRADKDIYQYFMSKGIEIIDDIEAFDGVHGLFIHRPKGGNTYIKVGYHVGLVDSETWLAVQDKKSHNQKFPSNKTSVNSWLTGITKCEYCKRCLAISYGWNVTHTKQWRFYLDRGAYYYNGCVKKRLKIRPDEVEKVVFNAMKNRLNELVIQKREGSKPDAAVDAIKANIIQLDDEIRKLLDRLADADDVLFEYIQKRVSELHSKKSEFEGKFREQSHKRREIDTKPLENPMKAWDSLSNEEKHTLASTMIDVVYVSDEHGIDIRFSI